MGKGGQSGHHLKVIVGYNYGTHHQVTFFTHDKLWVIDETCFYLCTNAAALLDLEQPWPLQLEEGSQLQKISQDFYWSPLSSKESKKEVSFLPRKLLQKLPQLTLTVLYFSHLKIVSRWHKTDLELLE